MKKQSLNDLIDALRKADAQFSKALDDRERFDSRRYKSDTKAEEAKDDAIGPC